MGADKRAINWLVFPLVVCIVFTNSYHGPAEQQMFEWSALTSTDIYNLLMLGLSRIAVNFAIPCLYVMFGYLFFAGVKKWNMNIYKSKLLRRVDTLLIPYLLWNIIAIVSMVAGVALQGSAEGAGQGTLTQWLADNGGIGGLLWDGHLWATDTSNWTGWSMSVTGPADFPLWFMRDMMVLSIFSPLLYWAISRLNVWFVLALAACYVSGVAPESLKPHVMALFYFSFGAYLGISNKYLYMLVRMDTSYLIAAILFVASMYLVGIGSRECHIVRSLYCMAAVVSAFCIAFKLTRTDSNMPSMLSGSAFFVLALHSVSFIPYIADLPYRLYAGDDAVVLSLLYIVGPIIKIALCIAIYAVMLRYTPRVLGVLTGSRI